MNFPVLKGAGYALVNTPDTIIQNGSTCQTEGVVNPDSEFLKEVGKHIRSLDEVVKYLPNQVYVGNVKSQDLEDYEVLFIGHRYEEGKVDGKIGKVVKQDVFIALLQMCDTFDLAKLPEEFVNETKPVIKEEYPILEPYFSHLKGSDISDAQELFDTHMAEALYHDGKVCGYIKAAHNIDVNLSAHTMLENLVVKALGVLAAVELATKNGINRDDMDYIIECSEEACGDANQRDGGNFAKSIAEVVGLQNTTGSDTRGSYAAPIHSLVEVSALVRFGAYKNVMVVADGSTAKSGMNAKNRVKRGFPVLEDVVGGSAILISENDDVHLVLRTDIVGRYAVKTGSLSQAVVSSLVSQSLEENGLKITDVDKYSVEMQNPDITKPTGAGSVPEANHKMITTLAVKQGELDRKELANFIIEKGLVGWASTQGHIPLGIPYAGHAIKDLTEGDYNRVMLVGKGSLFLGRMTNLFDGVSIVTERSDDKMEDELSVPSESEKDQIKKVIAESMRRLAENLLAE